jgi:hypothetical protein
MAGAKRCAMPPPGGWPADHRSADRKPPIDRGFQVARQFDPGRTLMRLRPANGIENSLDLTAPGILALAVARVPGPRWRAAGLVKQRQHVDSF